MKLGFIGLGKMGSRMVEKLLKEGHEVIVWNRTLDKAEQLQNQTQSSNLRVAKSVAELVQSLEKPRVIWSMLPAGEATQIILDELFDLVEENDIVIDGGNAFYQDTQRRYEVFSKKGVKFLGVGVSGGIIAAEKGYPLMVGGDKSAYEFVTPLLDSLAKPHGGHEYFGEGGAGHFLKMVHNAIEYGYMQALGEGFGVLEKSPYNLDLQKVAKLYQKGTLISGFMLDRGVEALEKDPHMEQIQGVIAESGEARWTIDEGKKQNLPIEVIEASLEFRKKSQTDSSVQDSFAAKFVAALRQAFGGHEVKKK